MTVTSALHTPSDNIAISELRNCLWHFIHLVQKAQTCVEQAVKSQLQSVHKNKNIILYQTVINVMELHSKAT